MDRDGQLDWEGRTGQGDAEGVDRIEGLGDPRPPLRVLIAGCGYVGTELGLQLAAPARDGATVWGLRRDPSRIPAPIRPLAADLSDPELACLLPEVDAVVYAASADRSEPGPYRAAYVDGLRNLLSAVCEQGSSVRQLIFVSSTAVYGDAASGWVDEATPTEPDSFRGEIVLEGERLALEAPLASTVVRLGGIYGPGRRRLIDQVRSGAPCPAGVWSNRIHRDDAAGIVRHLLDRGRTGEGATPDIATPEGATGREIFIGVDDEPALLCDVHAWVADLLGTPHPAPTEASGRRRSNKRCSNRRIREAGYHFRFPSYREGYGAMLAGGAGDGDGAGEGGNP